MADCPDKCPKDGGDVRYNSQLRTCECKKCGHTFPPDVDLP